MAIFSIYSNARVNAVRLKEAVHTIDAHYEGDDHPSREHWVRDEDVPISTFNQRLGDHIGRLVIEGCLRQYQKVDPNTGAIIA